MLILSRKKEESLIVDGNIEIKVLDFGNGIVKLGIIAPKEVEIHRKEIFEKIRLENAQSAENGKQLKQLMQQSKKNDNT